METNNDSDEKLAMDILTSSMYSLNFLKNITTAIFDHESLTIREFYDQWLRKKGFSGFSNEPCIPYQFGPIIGYLYCGILLAKENWFNLLPEEKIDVCSSDWGFSSVTYSYPKKPSPTIKDVFKRMRHALAHGRILINFPNDTQKDKNDNYDFEKKMTLRLHDVNMNDLDDTFDIEITLLGLSTAITKFHSIAYNHIMEKKVN